MPSLQDTVGQDLSAYKPVVTASPQASLPPTQDLAPTLNTVIRCPLPPIFQSNPDSLRQYFQGGTVPQFRIFGPATQTISTGNGGTTTESVVTTVVNGGSSTPASVLAQQAVLITPVLGPGATFQIAITKMSRSFQLLNVSSSSAARIELYGTAAAQLADISRALDTPPAAGTTQGLITDIALDTSPFTWNFQNRIGANGDVPQNPECYVTITNIGGAAVAITVTIQFVPLET